MLGTAVGQTLAMRTSLRRGLILVTCLACLAFLVSCSSRGGGDTPGEEAASTEDRRGGEPGDDGNPSQEELPDDASPLPTGGIDVPPVEPQPLPVGRDDTPEAAGAAERLTDCVAAGSCRDVDAPLVEWPGVDLSDVDLSFGKFPGVDLRGMDGSGGQFVGASFSGAILIGADFTGANLSGADLSGADLTGAKLLGANLSGAIFRDAVIDGADFTAALLCRTTMPSGLDRNDGC
jgi:hypothetical protein